MAESRGRVFFHFLHLLGVGHVFRAKRLIDGMVEAGLAVDAVDGGPPVDVDLAVGSLTRLPAIRATSADYATMVGPDGRELSEAFLQDRTNRLLAAFHNSRPDVVLIEAFPFGRRVVRKELLALIAAARAMPEPPLIVSSVRDILQEGRKKGRVEEARDWVRDHFDHVLVHSDPNIIDLGATFHQADEIADHLAYTGFVVPPVGEAPADIPRRDVIVSAGGGGFGEGLMDTALDVALSEAERGHRWCLSTGPKISDGAFEAMQNRAGSRVEIVRRLDGLVHHLGKVGISISQCGYNTAMDVLTAHGSGGCRAVFVPYDTEGQTEQKRRAELLAKAGYAVSLPQSRLTISGLAAAVAEARQLPKVDGTVDFTGVETTAKLLCQWIDSRRQS